MTRPDRKGERLVGLFVLGCLLFNFPFLALFNVRATLLGVPVLYVYLFAAWSLLIVLAALILERPD